MDKKREAFEAWAKAPPREFYLARHPDAAAWPGNYKDYHVECAWQAWQVAQQAQWQPIETAPRDGRPVLCGWSNGEEPCVCYWREIVSGWSAWHGYPEFDDQPTHWMPLPPEPKP